MNGNIRSLNSRLRRLERKGASGSVDDFYGKMSDSELWCLIEMPLSLDDEEEFEYIANELGWTIEKAKGFWAALNRFLPILQRQLRHMSDEQIEAELLEPFDSAV